MVGRTIELRSLGEQDISWHYMQLNSSTIVPSRNAKDFSPLGTFAIMERQINRSGYYSSPKTMWAQRLLDYDPEASKLTIERGQLIVRDSQRNVLKSIPPRDVRQIGIEAEIGTVRKSGYVLADHFYPLGAKRDMAAEEFEGILKAVEEGQASPGFSDEPRVKVDSILCGKKLWIGMFEFELGRDDIYDRDAVVIDPETRQMIEREVVHTLSYQR